MIELTTNQKGIVAETAIIHEAAKLGIIVSRPLDDARYDLILDLSSAVAGYCFETGTCYLLPAELFSGTSLTYLRLESARNKQNARIHWARDYEFAARLNGLGPIAQLGERLAGSQKVGGSSPPGSIG
jgi:PD-(D/E)XK endonuclease